MGTEINVNFAIGNVKFDISEFVVAIKNLSRSALRSGTASQELSDAMSLIRQMIQETRTSFDTIVDIITPLQKINSRRMFTTKFDDIHSDFKRHYRKRRSLPRTHCEPIKKLMDKLNKKREWMKNIPIAKRSFKQLQDICSRWATSDDQIVADMTYLMDQLNEFLKRAAQLKRANVDEAYAEFQFGLEVIEDNFQSVERSLSDLSIISKELGA